MPPEFKTFDKIARLRRSCVITEKIDGTNSVVYVPSGPDEPIVPGSRNQWLVNGVDNFGFARWVFEHQNELREGLGPGYHYGEWWGAGIGRRYGALDKRFSLFNTTRWAEQRPPCCRVVPVLYQGLFTSEAVTACLETLRSNGSVAAPGFMQPEGVVVYHEAGRILFKQTLERDEEYKGKGGAAAS